MRAWGLFSIFIIGLCLPGGPAQASFSLQGSLNLAFLRDSLSLLWPSLFHAIPPEAELKPPPETLLVPLVNGNEDFIKGMEPTAEAELASALLSLPLHQRLLKVAVATIEGRRMALIKFQAGDVKTRLFRIPDVQYDAINALRVAFALPLNIQHIDLWSVIPDRKGAEPVHRTVFSVSAEREEFMQATRGLRYPQEMLSDLGLIRFAPEFLRYAGGEPVSRVARFLPDTAWSAAPLRYSWEQLLTACQQDPRLPAASVARIVVHIPVTDNSVALTIDDGPHPLITALFLDILKRRNIRATFFVVGEKVEEYPELLRRILEEGHEIGNHTYSHPRLAHTTDVETLAEIRGGALAIGRVTGRPTRLFRPPGGGFAEHVLRAATAAHSSVILWTHNTNDWLRPTPEQIAANALRDLRPGSIILMHQGSLESVQALPLIIDGAQARGFDLRPVGELLSQAPVSALPIQEIMAKYQRHELGRE